MPDLTLGDEVADGPGDVFDRYVRVDPVLVEQIDAVGPQSLEHLVDDLADVVWSAVQSSRFELETEFRGQHDLVADRFERFADQGLVRQGPVRLSGVEERHSLVVGASDEVDAVLDVDRVAVVGAEAHAAEPDR